MKLVKSFKVTLNISYADYLKTLEGRPCNYDELLEKFITKLSKDSKEEIVKFFSLDPEDADDLEDNNFAIGYKIVSDNREQCILTVNVRIDIKTEGIDEVELPEGFKGGFLSMADIMKMVPEKPSEDGFVADIEALEVPDDTSTEVSEEISENISDDETEEDDGVSSSDNSETVEETNE